MLKQLENQIYYLRERFRTVKEYQSGGLESLRALAFLLRVLETLMKLDEGAFEPSMLQRSQAINDAHKCW